MNYTKVPPEINLELSRIKKETEFDLDKCMIDPSMFAKQILNITPFTYQHLILRKFHFDYKGKNDRTIICKSRQMGISTAVAILAIWYAGFNRANEGKGTGIHKNTKVGLISKSDSQSKKLMREIQNLIWNSKEDFVACVKREKSTPLNKNEIWFQEGCIKCFPPTESCRGETFDLLIVDEAAFVDSLTFKDAMEPTVCAVGGKIILSSTPKGQSGFYFELFDPFEIRKNHQYDRFWFYWKQCESELQLRIIRDELKHAKETGTLKSFDQEHNALFTVDQEAFFENNDIDNGIDRDSTLLYESKETCSIGLDYGISKAETCITVVAKTGNILRLRWQFAQTNLDDNLLTDTNWEHSIQNLCKRYKVEFIVVDDCPQGIRTNKELENLGYPVRRFDFRSERVAGEKNRGYYIFRAALKKGRIKYPDIRDLVYQMKVIQEVRMQTNMRIKAPTNYRDDRVESCMMACYPFLVESDASFSSVVLDYEGVLKSMKPKDNYRHDFEWETIKNRFDPLDYTVKREVRT